MLSNLPFFPQSFPDETLLSRMSRYHLLSGNRSEHATFRDLFDSPPFPFNVVIPKQIDKLAARLPGQMDETLQQLLSENTLLSLFIPFLGIRPPAGSADEGSLPLDGWWVSMVIPNSASAARRRKRPSTA